MQMNKSFWIIPHKLAGRAGPDIEPCDLAALWAGGGAGGTLVKNSSRCEQCQASRGDLPYGSISVRVAALA